jgi:hypothetical protein
MTFVKDSGEWDSMGILDRYDDVPYYVQERISELEHEIAKLKKQNDPLLDGTDFAHPAYWRGQESGVDGACMRIEEVLDGKYSGAGVIAHPRLEKLVRRLDRMMGEKKVTKK